MPSLFFKHGTHLPSPAPSYTPRTSLAPARPPRALRQQPPAGLLGQGTCRAPGQEYGCQSWAVTSTRRGMLGTAECTLAANTCNCQLAVRHGAGGQGGLWSAMAVCAHGLWQATAVCAHGL